MEVGAGRAARDEGAFSYCNVKTVVIGDEIAGMVLSYQLPDAYDTDDIESYPDVIRPLVEFCSSVTVTLL